LTIQKKKKKKQNPKLLMTSIKVCLSAEVLIHVSGAQVQTQLPHTAAAIGLGYMLQSPGKLLKGIPLPSLYPGEPNSDGLGKSNVTTEKSFPLRQGAIYAAPYRRLNE
jgi:hypothetical protein